MFQVIGVVGEFACRCGGLRNDARELKDASKQSPIKKIAKGMRRPRQNLIANPDGSIDL
jgi:hypothetical protein